MGWNAVPGFGRDQTVLVVISRPALAEMAGSDVPLDGDVDLADRIERELLARFYEPAAIQVVLVQTLPAEMPVGRPGDAVLAASWGGPVPVHRGEIFDAAIQLVTWRWRREAEATPRPAPARYSPPALPAASASQ